MLENFNSVDWNRLTHAYGEAADVPDLIRALAPIRNRPHIKSEIRHAIENGIAVYRSVSRMCLSQGAPVTARHNPIRAK